MINCYALNEFTDQRVRFIFKLNAISFFPSPYGSLTCLFSFATSCLFLLKNVDLT